MELWPITKFKKIHKDALIYRAYPEDTGWDINLVDVKKKVGEVTFFGTGLMLEPPPGYYFKIEARSSISKTDWILANGVGNLDNYRGEIIVPLRKVTNSPFCLDLPQRLVQLVLYRKYDCTWKEVDELSKSDRGDKGFGSSGK